MKIDSSEISLASRHALVERHSLSESLRVQQETAPPARPAGDPVSLSDAGKAAQQADRLSEMREAVENDPRMQLLIGMIEALTGRKIRILSMRDLQTIETLPPEAIQDSGQIRPNTDFGLEYERHETRYEAERTNFSAQGTIRTADGREIAFDLQLSMSREAIRQTDISVRLGDAQRHMKDPLVINFNSGAAQLTSSTFTFDLNADGSAENISFVMPGSGFLALDKNQDGRINDGGELFGPASGNGFGELSTYDQDGNRWIDENDAVFASLRVWSKDERGNDRLSPLRETGIGALYLGSVSTEFSLKDNDNHLDGQVRASGVYLNEDGTVGTLQQIDLAA